MAPSTKKRKEPHPNTTLMDFFPGADATKRAKLKTPQQLMHVERQNKMVSREIIVIDSDSDDDVHGKGSGGRGSVRLDSSAENKDTFGAPSELLRPVPQYTAHSPSPAARKPDQSESMFGVSAPLLEQAPIRNKLPGSEGSRSESFTLENTFTTVEGNPADDPAVGLPIGDRAIGDDELVVLKVSDNSTEIDEGGAELFDEQTFCPVCNMDLTGILVFEAETHVNQCLDKTSQNDSFAMQECASIAVSIKPDVTSNDDNPGTLIKGHGGDLYTVLMNSHKEDEFWVEADATANRDSSSTRGNRRRAPFYKVLQGMPIAVDAFCYGTIPGITAYFLTHAHSDHYTNLGSKWNSGPIYCSEETANLIIHMLAVDPRWIHPLPLDRPTVIPNTGGVTVTLIEANHCPGSSLFFFEGQQTIDAGDSVFKSPSIGSPRIFRYLHCGDFRASPRHVLHPAVNGKHIDHIYLDTTYLDSKYTFSPQPLVISACAELARRRVVGGAEENPDVHINGDSTLDVWMKSLTSAGRGGPQMIQGRTLVIVGTYSIGKERIVKAIAQALGTKIHCDSRKTAILRCQTDKELHALLTADPVEAGVHILPLGAVTSENLRTYLQRFKGTFSRVIGFRPTGWTYSPPSGSHLSNVSIQSIISHGQSCHFSYADLQPSQKSSYNIQIFGVPYSEHSSFFELTCFAMSCDWGRMIPTVNVGNPTSRAKMTRWLRRWESEKRCTKPSVISPRTADYW